MRVLQAILLCLPLLCEYGQAGDPVGHLKPLGEQTLPTVPIDEFTIDNAPHPYEFYENYVKPSKAAIFRGVMLNTSGFQLWTDKYIKENYGTMEVRVEGKKEKESRIPVGEKYLGRDSIGHFVDHYHLPNTSMYMVSELPEVMFKEVGVLPSVGACGEMAKRFVEIDIWWNGGGGRSVIHKDAFNQINCLYRGDKDWKLYEYKYEKWIHKHWEPENEVGGYSEVDVDAVDMYKHPNIAKIPWSNFTIHAGDCLFLPKSYYHQVISKGIQNLAVSILFGRFDGVEHIDVSDCHDETDYKTPKPLSELDVMWKWSGTGMMSMGRGDFESGYRSSLLDMAEELQAIGQELNADAVAELWGSGGEDDGKIRHGKYDKAVAILDSDGDGKLTVDEIKSVTWSQFREFGFEVEPHEPSNSYLFEYSLITYDRVVQILKHALRKKTTLTRDIWVRLYTKVLEGTPEFANKIFNGLVGSEEINEIESASVT
uniref:JmjC domain-containing protein n=1 Tax=Ciona savignyi TaxID=51511 RepID=H2ZJQ1_CIOSA